MIQISKKNSPTHEVSNQCIKPRMEGCWIDLHNAAFFCPKVHRESGKEARLDPDSKSISVENAPFSLIDNHKVSAVVENQETGVEEGEHVKF